MKVGIMNKLNVIWRESFIVDKACERGETHNQIILFIYENFIKHSVNMINIGFMGTVYGKTHISVRVPGLMELAIGQFYTNRTKQRKSNYLLLFSFLNKWQAWFRSFSGSEKNDRYFSISPQRLNLVDERVDGLNKMADAYRAFETKAGIICWYGENEFEVMMVSSDINS